MSARENDGAALDAALEESAEELYEDAPCGYLSSVEGGRIVKANRTFLAWTGYEREQLLGGKRLQDVLAPGDRIYYETHLAPLLRMQGHVREIAVEIVRADGSRFPALVNSRLRAAGEAGPTVVRTTVLDARERRRYEQELLEARRQLEDRAHAAEALALARDGVVFVDADGRLRLVNPAAESILAVDGAAALGVPLAEAVPGWGPIESRVPLGAPGRWPRPSVLPFARGGQEAWLSLAGVATGDGVVYTIRDVTSERELEELRSDVVDVVSHELRTPLSGIYGAAQTLLEHGEALPPDGRRGLLELIVEQSRRQERVLDAILLTRNLERGSVETSETVCEAGAVIAGALAALDDAEAARVVVEDGGPLSIRADTAAAEQALANVLENALKYSPPGSEVRVRCAPAERRVRITVADEGPGIPADARELVFGRFYRLDPKQRGGVAGVGLGLYVTRELVTRMGGRVGLLPAERGTTVFIDLVRA